MANQQNYVFAQILGSATRAICAAIQATGPSCILPKIEQGREPTEEEKTRGEVFGWDPQTEGQVRRGLWMTSLNHLERMQEGIEFLAILEE